MGKPHILLVDDDQHILDLLHLILERENVANIHLAKNGTDTLSLCRNIPFDLIVLDVMLPDIDGFTLCTNLRKITQVPILFLTAKNTDLNILSGFHYGADDYITKPFNPLEVIARIKVHLRRQKPLESKPSDKWLTFERFRINENTGQLLVEEKEVVCPAKEFQLLAFLCKHPQQIFTKNQLYEKIWGHDSLGETHTVSVHIHRLREKIEKDPSRPEYLLTIRGLGYKLIHPFTKG
jgi:DNA-binding response OmpR family regulator